MIWTGKYLDSLEIIRDVYRDNSYSYELDYSSAIEWVVDAIGLIGTPLALKPSQCRIKIHNYKGKIPCDVYNIDQAAGSFNGCTPFPMRSTTNTFGAVDKYVNMQINPQLIEGPNIGESVITQPIGEDISGNPVYYFQGGNIALPGVISTSPTSLWPYKKMATYSLNDSFIFTSFKDGYVFLAYEGLPVNCDGFPLIPDTQRYKEAIKCYIRFKIDYILWRSNEIDEKVFKYSEQDWLFYVGSAATNLKMPSKDGLRSVLNKIRMIPQIYSHDNFSMNN